jgi:ABC-type multidrug transport system fused ATPase/permease subunit
MDAFVKIDSASHLIVLKTMPGNAQAIGALMDNLDWEEIMGTICGDDTILIICRTHDDTESRTEENIGAAITEGLTKKRCHESLLAELSIKNFAIIEELTVSFEKGLTVLTGETGAGKSIIIDAVSLACRRPRIV